MQETNKWSSMTFVGPFNSCSRGAKAAPFLVGGTVTDDKGVGRRRDQTMCIRIVTIWCIETVDLTQRW